MSTTGQPSAAPPPRPRGPFQFTWRTLLLLIVVAASSLAVFGAGGIVVFAIVVGLAVYIHLVESLRSLAYLALAVLCLTCILSLLLLPGINAAREAGYRAWCLNQMHQLGLALYNYHGANKCFPPAHTTDKSGKPLHSWRTLVLPYLEYQATYNRLDHAQPWDSPKNKSVLTFQPREFVCPSDPSSDVPGTMQTNYFAVVGPNTAWDRSRPLAPSDKEASHTIMLVEVADSGVAWAEPRDFSLDALAVVDAQGHAHAISSNHRPPDEFFFAYDSATGVDVAFADGSVAGLLRTGDLSPEELRKILQIGGCTNEVLAAHFGYKSRLNLPNIAALAVWLISVVTLLAASVRSRKVRIDRPPPAVASEPQSRS